MHLIGRGPTLKHDSDLVARAKAHGLAPGALSWWYSTPGRSENGLVLSFTNINSTNALEMARRLRRAMDL
jgi:DNA-binding transcriptional MocR family regulator